MTKSIYDMTIEELASLTTMEVQAIGANDLRMIGNANPLFLINNSYAFEFLKKLNSVQVQYLSVSLFSQGCIWGSEMLPNAFYQGLTATQMASFSMESLKYWGSAQIKLLRPVAITGLTPTSVAAFTMPQLRALPAPQSLSAAALKAIGKNNTNIFVENSDASEFLTNLNSDQVQYLSANLFAQGCIWGSENLSSAFYQGLTANQMATFSTESLKYWGPTQIKLLRPAAIAGLTPAGFASVGTNTSQGATDALGCTAIGALTPTQIGALTATQVATFSMRQLAALRTPQSLSIGALSAIGKSNASIFVNNDEAAVFLSKLNSTQVQSLSATLFAQGYIRGLERLPSSFYQGLTATQMASFSRDNLKYWGPEQIKLLRPTTLAGMAPDNFVTLGVSGNGSPIAATNGHANVLAALTLDQMAALTVAQVATLTALDLASLTTAQIQAIGVKQAASLSIAQLSAKDANGKVVLFSLANNRSLTKSQTTYPVVLSALEAFYGTIGTTVTVEQMRDLDTLLEAVRGSYNGANPYVTSILSNIINGVSTTLHDAPGSPVIEIELKAGQILKSGESVKANNVALIMQSDGNLVELIDNVAVWSTNTWGHPGAQATIQKDGNFVIYDENKSPIWASSWASDASSSYSSGKSSIFLGDNGDLSISTSHLQVGDMRSELRELIDQWLLGKNNPTPLPSDSYVDYSASQLFPTDIRNAYSTLKQGAIGDCYLVAALIANAAAMPASLYSMISKNENNTYAVRFYGPNGSNYVTVDSWLPKKTRVVANDGSVWAGLVEKAFIEAQAYGIAWPMLNNYTDNMNDNIDNTYGDIAGGGGDQPLKSITGMGTTQYSLSDFSIKSLSPGGSVHNAVSMALSAHQSIVFTTGKKPPSGLIGSHMYAVTGISPVTGNYVFNNPWGPPSLELSAEQLSASKNTGCFIAANRSIW